MLRLTWKGRSGSELIKFWRTALTYRGLDKVNEAETRLKDAWEGLRHILGATHEHTSKAAYSLANLYASTNRMDDAVACVERVLQDHVKILSYQNKTTQQRVIQAAEILNGWNRSSNALSLLSCSKEFLDKANTHHRSANKCNIDRKRHAKGKDDFRTGQSGSETEISQIMAQGFGEPGSQSLEWGLSVAQRHVLAADQGADRLLLTIISECEARPAVSARDHIVARGKLLELFQKLGTALQHTGAF